MNAPVVVAQASSQATAGTPRVIRIVPPAGGDRVQIALGSDDQARLDLTALAGQAFTLVRAAETLIILFDNNSAVEVHPFFDRASGPRADITIEMAPGQVVSGAEFVALFPVTDDPSVLPAAGDVNSSGFAFTAVAIDALGTPAPLPLLGSEVLPDVIATQDFARGLDILALRPSDTESLPPPPPPPPPFDDAPVAVSDAATVEAGAVAPVDLILIIDASESMNRITGDFGFTTYSEVARMLLTGLINAAEVNQLSIVWSGAAPGGGPARDLTRRGRTDGGRGSRWRAGGPGTSPSSRPDRRYRG